MELSSEQLRRYSRHVILPEVGVEGQKRLCAARVLCIGAGGLGSPLMMYLVAAGVGVLGVVDEDTVEETNLQRQILHGHADLGQPKTESARRRLRDLNPKCDVRIHTTRLNRDNVLEILRDYDILVDGTDNFPTRYLTNDACVMLGKPNVYGSIFRFEGQASVFAPHLGGPCYRCLFPEPPPPGEVPSCAEGGVFGVLPGVIGCLQATEVIKLVVGTGTPLIGRLLLYDALGMKFRELRLRRDPECPVCGKNPTLTKLADYERLCGLPVGSGVGEDEVTVQEMKRVLDHPELGIQVVDVRETHELALARVGGVLSLPLSDLPSRFTELNANQMIYLHCKAGVRSLQALEYLRERGFKYLKSVRGGIDAWSKEIDPGIPRY